ncbi:DUF4065 domain-containing protein [Clostridium perfringens]
MSFVSDNTNKLKEVYYFLVNANGVASYIIKYCNEKGYMVNNLKLQKLLYYIALYYFKKTGEMLYLEDIVYWRHGPVVQEVYSNYRYRLDWNISEVSQIITYSEPNDDIKELVRTIVDIYSEYGAWDMVDKIQNELEPVFKEVNSKLIKYTIDTKHKIVNISILAKVLDKYPSSIFC